LFQGRWAKTPFFVGMMLERDLDCVSFCLYTIEMACEVLLILDVDLVLTVYILAMARLDLVLTRLRIGATRGCGVTVDFSRSSSLEQVCVICL
jgi:hypothetical protein